MEKTLPAAWLDEKLRPTIVPRPSSEPATARTE